ncbi:ABC transporter permease [Solitalea sp. MAHUQ-68]|uniref:ABC transporter permease n=1 Tax=Solitalea agri TaxID=2953739 RepID=A0A9X2JDX6_9SPHI|nr:ABC transporter permease [Solitalea agri]MCO4291836.1 ABC transporter permease [Solitalea agri]
MFRNYFKIAFRNLIRRKTYSLLNIAGLAIGIASCLLLFMVIRYELSYDKFQPNFNRIYHVVTEDKNSEGIDYTPGVPFPALDAFRTDFPQVKTGALFSLYGSQVTVLNNGKAVAEDKKFIEENGMCFCDPVFFEVFNFNWLAGNKEVLAQPNMVVLTQKMAEKYFGDWHTAIGQSVKLDNTITLKVAGILSNPPANTDFPLGLVASFITMKNNPSVYYYTTDWGSTTSSFQVFMLLPEKVSAASINAQLKKFSLKHYQKSDPSRYRLNYLHPIAENHFDTRFGNLGDHVTSKPTLITLSFIGVLIIIMACINFVNLSTALAIGRSKEVGVRKVLGSDRKQLIGQMMSETAFIVIVSALVAVLIAWLILPYLKHVVSLPEQLSLFSGINFLFLLIIITVVTILSGFYPSLILSGFQPVLALKSKLTTTTIGGISLRRGLVVLQFAMSQILVVATIVAVSQMNYIRTADLGFNKEAILVLKGNSDSASVARQKSFKEELLSIPGVKAVSFSTDVPSSENNWGTNFAYDHRPDEKFPLFLKFGDLDYVRTYGLQLVAGRGYFQSDTINEVLVNETLMNKMGVKNAQDMIGKEIRLGGQPWKQIVGVVKDFKTNSLRETVKPLLIAANSKFYSVTSIKLLTNNLSKAQKNIEKSWNKFYPEYAYSGSYMDESIAHFYQQEEQLAVLYKIFAGLALFISCLGLYGLVSFMAVQKTKEVGIRKVLGASVANIIYLFSKEFTILIAIAFFIAAPTAYYIMNNWLSNFAYRISIGVGVFALAIVLSILIAWITVGYKALKAAVANPVKSLRTE